MQTYVVGPTETYTTIAAALAAVAAATNPFVEIHQIEVKEGIALANVSIPVGVIPTASYPLHLVNYEFHRPKVQDVALSKAHIKMSGFEIMGDTTGGLDDQFFTENLIHGTASFIGNGTPRTVKVYNNVVDVFNKDGIIMKDLGLGGSRCLFNTFHARTGGFVPKYALQIDESSVEVRSNIITAAGESNFSRAIFVKNTTAQVVTCDKNLYFLFGAAQMGAFQNTPSPVLAGTFNQWKLASGLDLNSMYEDPRFECIDDLQGINLNIANDSPAVAMALHDTEVIIDFNKTRRPYTTGLLMPSTTLGGYEQAERITEGGKRRILELISGLSTDAITKVAVGDEGAISGAELLEPEVVDPLATDLENRIFIQSITERTVVDLTPANSVAYFDCFLGPNPKLTEALLDGKIDVLEEVGLLCEDNLLFLRRTFYQIPFDPLSVVTTRLKFGISIGPCMDLSPDAGPELDITAEAVV